MSSPSYAHAETNSCFQLQLLHSAFLFSWLWAQLGERTQSNPFHTGCRANWGGLPPHIWQAGKGGGGSITLPLTISVSGWWHNQFFFLDYFFSSDWMTSLQTSSYSVLYSEGQAEVFFYHWTWTRWTWWPLVILVTLLLYRTHTSVVTCGTAISSCNKKDNWTHITWQCAARSLLPNPNGTSPLTPTVLEWV